jgi:hypothetical protein
VQLRHPDAEDPIARALDCAVRCANDVTEDHPLTPERFWEELKQDGFAFTKPLPGTEEAGRFFAHVVLDHAVGLGRIAGNTALHHYWASGHP